MRRTGCGRGVNRLRLPAGPLLLRWTDPTLGEWRDCHFGSFSNFGTPCVPTNQKIWGKTKWSRACIYWSDSWLSHCSCPLSRPLSLDVSTNWFWWHRLSLERIFRVTPHLLHLCSLTRAPHPRSCTGMRVSPAIQRRSRPSRDSNASPYAVHVTGIRCRVQSTRIGGG